MKIYDAHIHSVPGNIDPERLIADMETSGVYGGSVFSPDPEKPRGIGYSYEERMACLEKWTKGYEDRLFPVLFIHPLEKDAIAKARDAVDRGVRAFKMMCDCYYVYEKPAMDLLEVIAEMDKPVLFHSGILWDGYESSKHNRPVNWESLINIAGLRFSLAHCSWPWCDECIAMYGKFLNAYATNPECSAEMFMDLTPGTPIIYRHDLINKLLNSGYDTPHNIMFGTDCTANEYNIPWTKGWIERDDRLMTEVGAGKRVHELYFGENYLRFMGVTKKDFQHIMPVPDRADAWSLDYANKTL